MAVASIGFGFAGSAAELGIARLAQGFGSALSWAGALAWLVAGTPRERRGEMLGTAIGAAIFGALLGPALGALAEAIGTRPAFVGVAGVSRRAGRLGAPHARGRRPSRSRRVRCSAPSGSRSSSERSG